MPMSDAIAYIHGAGASAYGSQTSTVNSSSSTTIAGTVMTVGGTIAGQFQVGQTILGPGVLAGTTILSLGTGIGLAGTYNVSQSQTISSAIAITATPNTPGDAYCASGSQYSNVELDFGSPTAALTNPLSFPSYAQKAYTFPAEVVGDGGVEFGLHIQVGGYANLLTSINFEVCTASTTGALYTAANNPIAARTLTLAQLSVAAHYFVPVNFASVLEFLRVYMALTGTNPTAGTISMWFGPKTGGEQ
jgi:hypothetical protein